MSLADRIEALAARIATEAKAIRALIPANPVGSGNASITGIELHESDIGLPQVGGVLYLVPEAEDLFASFEPGVTEPFYTQTADFDAAPRNVGVDPSVTLTTWGGTYTAGIAQITDGGTYQNLIFDGGIVEVRSNATFINCRFILPPTFIAENGTQALVQILNGASMTDVTFEKCEFHIRCQRPFNCVSGRNASFDRCVLTGCTDPWSESSIGSAPLTSGLTITNCFVPALAWWYSPTLGDVHGGDYANHADGIQKSTSSLLTTASNTVLLSYVDEFIGTGTPGSGRDAGGTYTDPNAGTDYTATQATMEGWRATHANEWTTPSQSYGGVSHRLPTLGTHAGIMFNADNFVGDKLVFGGGLVPINAVDEDLPVSMNIHITNSTWYNDMLNGNTSRGTNPLLKGYAVLMRTGKDFQTFTGNTWFDGTAVTITKY